MTGYTPSLVMTMSNKHIKRLRISEAKFSKLLKHFSLDLDTQIIATLTRLNHRDQNIYKLLLNYPGENPLN